MADRFWSKTTVDPIRGCVLWQGSRNPEGYGWYRLNGRIELAHRVSWLLAHGPIPTDMCVLHRCDIPSCVETTHLFLGTRQENSDDMKQKQRQCRGAAMNTAKLTPASVRSIRELLKTGTSQRDIAQQFGTHQSTVSRIATGRNWNYLDE